MDGFPRPWTSVPQPWIASKIVLALSDFPTTTATNGKTNGVWEDKDLLKQIPDGLKWASDLFWKKWNSNLFMKSRERADRNRIIFSRSVWSQDFCERCFFKIVRKNAGVVPVCSLLWLYVFECIWGLELRCCDSNMFICMKVALLIHLDTSPGPRLQK